MVNGMRAAVPLPTGNRQLGYNARCRADDQTPIG